MSRRASYRYSTEAAARQAAFERRRQEAQQRQEAWKQRVTQTTSAHLDRYEGILQDMREQGLADLVNSEFAELSGLLERASSLVHSDPGAARDISKEIGPRIGQLPRVARQLRAEHRPHGASTRTDRETQHRRPATGDQPAQPAHGPETNRPSSTPAESPMAVAWEQAIASWTDLLARDLAFDDLAELRSEIGPGGTLTDPAQVKSRMEGLQSKWLQEADKQRAEEARLAAQLSAEESADDAEWPEAESTAVPLSDSQDPEESRREAVRAVIGALEGAGFLVPDPRLVNGEVIVVGTRPSGATATFALTQDGALDYDFSGYRGSSCETDINAVVPALQEIYGITLTDEVEAWRNPDDEDATSRPQPGRTRNA